MNRILRLALSLAQAVILSARIEGEAVVIGVRPHKRPRRRCPVCGGRCDAYDARPGPRRWRALDLAQSMCFLEYQAVRVRCPEHGVRVEAVPWARHGSRFTRGFEDRVAWMAVHCTASAVAAECRVEWHSVGGICARVYAELEASRGPRHLDGLRRIGIDETSYRKGRKRITVVVDHDRGRLVWAGEGYGREVLGRFLDMLTHEQRMAVEVAAADGAKWIKGLVRERCPNAEWVMDPFHVVSWMNDALDAVRREEWQAAARAAREAAPRRGRPPEGDEAPHEAKAPKAAAAAIKGARYALVKNPEDLTEEQRATLDEVRRAHSRTYRAWELKEGLRAVFRAEGAEEAGMLLDGWLSQAARCRIPKVVDVARKVRARRDDIVAAVALGISNARVEAINNKVKVTVRMGYGFRNIDNLIALLMLRCSDVMPQLPGRPIKARAGKAAPAA